MFMEAMKYSISIDHDNRIIRYKHSGSISKQDIGEAWTEFLGMEEFTHKKYNLLSDYSDGKFEISISELDEIIDFLSDLKNIINGKKQAFIVNDPYSTAASLLFEADVIQKVGFIVKPFSTEAAALRWLKS